MYAYYNSISRSDEQILLIRRSALLLLLAGLALAVLFGEQMLVDARSSEDLSAFYRTCGEAVAGTSIDQVEKQMAISTGNVLKTESEDGLVAYTHRSFSADVCFVRYQHGRVLKREFSID